MANPNKAKGTAWETEVVNYLNEDALWRAERTGSADTGASDIHAGDWTFEAKAEREIDLPGYLKQLAASTERADRVPYLAGVWVKNRRHSVKDAYVVMSGENYRNLMAYVVMMETVINAIEQAGLIGNG